MTWIDVTLPLEESTPPYPGDPGLTIQRLRDYERGDDMQLSAISLSAHLGTHVDAPLHFIRAGVSVDQLSLDTLIGPTHVVEVLTQGSIDVEQLLAVLPLPCARLLIKTTTSRALLPRPKAWLAPEAAQLLVKKKIRFIGIDSPSVDACTATQAETHQLLLKQGLIIVENLELSAIAAGAYDMICLPLKLAGLEGAPARVVLRKQE